MKETDKMAESNAILSYNLSLSSHIVQKKSAKNISD